MSYFQVSSYILQGSGILGAQFVGFTARIITCCYTVDEDTNLKSYVFQALSPPNPMWLVKL